MTIDGPPARVLDGIARYFRSRDNVLDLVVPLKRVGEPGTLALERKVIVELEHHRDRLLVGQHDVWLSFQWRPEGDTRVSFIGRFIIRPSGSGTVVALKGEYQPPFEPLEPPLGAVFDEHAAHATGRVLLEGIKGRPRRGRRNASGIQIHAERQKLTILDSRPVGRPAAVEKLTCAARATNRRPAGNGIQDEVGPKAEHAQRIRVDRPGSRVWAERNTAPSARNVNHIPAALSHEKAMLREVTAPARGDMRPATTPFAGGNALEAGRPGH